MISRYRFFGRETISFLVVLPIALPGIVTGLALNATINTVFEPIGIGFGLTTIVIGHATFCIVVVYNNVIARLRRTSLSFEEASSDLGADSVQTFRLVTLPALGTALLAGGLLAFGLSFDEVIVTVFTAGSGRDASDLDLREPRAPERAPRDQRRRARRDRDLDHPRLGGAEAGRANRRGRGEGSRGC